MYSVATMPPSPLSLVQLQEEKEKHFQESRSSFEEMVRSKDHQIGGLQSKLEALKNDLNSRKEVCVDWLE